MSSQSSRSLHVRTKVVALLVSLVALWSFAAFVTVREGLNLLFVSTLDQGIAQPNEQLLPALQDERRLTLIYLGNPTSSARQAMLDQRERTDEAAANFRTQASAGSVRFAADPDLERGLDATFAQLDTLTRERSRMENRAVDRPTAAGVFAAVSDSIFRLYDEMATVDDDEIAKDARTLIQLTRAREIWAREDAMLAGALAAGEVTAAEYEQFVQLVGTQRFLYREAVEDLPEADQAMFRDLFESATFTRVRALEDQVVSWTPGDSLPVSAAEWSSALRPAFAEVHQAVLTSGDGVVERATPVAVAVIIRLALAGVLGLIAVIASVIVSITTARALIRQLERLRNTARDLASYRLPRVVERLQHGEKVDVEQEAPPLDFGNDEIGQVGQAFNAVQETAVRVAVEQAELRRSVRDVFLSLARRSQALLHRQLGLLDAMERRATDSEELAELFRVDHLATRMRRNAENLIVLSGATAGRAWRRPVPVVDVLRGALAEVEDYTRVTVLPVGPAALVGRAVGDVIHLLAELIENAVSFSPPQTVVRVGGSVVGSGFAIEIEDRGLGMSDEERAAANEQLRNPPEFKLSSTARLGLYVVGKLAERHGIRVRLTESPYGGTTAIVLLPAALIAEEVGDPFAPIEPMPLESGRASQLASVSGGRHRSDDRGAEPGEVVSAQLLPPPGPGPADQAPLFAEVVNNGGAPAGRSTGGPTAAAAGSATVARPGAAVPGISTPSNMPGVTVPGAVTTTPESTPRDADPPRLTPSGLPWRPRPPRSGTPAPGVSAPVHTGSAPDATTAGATADPLHSPTGAVPTMRSAEDLRHRMTSYRSGTLRGRNDAALLAEGFAAPGWPAAEPEPPASTLPAQHEPTNPKEV
ncbi:MAG TPA: nitrate- and nitrite sensing domain-containing protein [Micromonosporaceae bacterium]